MKSNTILATYVFLLLFSFVSLVNADTPIFEEELSKMKSDIALMKQNLDQLTTQGQKTESDKPTSFQAHYNDITARFGGKYTQEAFVGRYLTFLNKDVQNDTSFFIRTTVDYFMDFVFGDYKKPRIMIHDTFRFRYKWGSGTEVRVEDGVVRVVNTNINARGTMANKHLLWSREAWIKIAIGNIEDDYDHFIQLGLFPFQVGRGITLGPAFQAGGFLGFSPGFSIDQFAPGALLHINPVPERISAEFYIGFLENPHTSFKKNEEVVRLNEIDGCPKRGTNRYSFVVALRSIAEVLDKENSKLFLEPYIVYLQAPDQKLEFANDTDSFLTTYGMAIEGQQGKFEWGVEGAVNHGDALVKPWDRNMIEFARNDDGLIEERYSKVFSDDPLTTSSPTKATVTTANQTVVQAGSKGRAVNGQEIASGSGIYNAFDRFRPEQRRLFEGFFFVADCSYQFIDEVLKWTIGTGYSSGDLDKQENANKLSSEELKNRTFSGFVPIQSVYSGKRLRHLIILNEGVPRFNTQNPNGTFTNQNVTPPASPENIEFRNIAFIGTRVDWNVERFKEHKVLFAPNLIFYWAPETPQAFDGGQTSNFMGTELMAEISAVLYKKLKLYSYIGALFPGQYYKDMMGTVLNPKEPTQTTAHDVAFIANIGMSFAF